MSFVSPTAVQAGSIPPALSGKDVVGTAQTGTGKTAAFAVPMITALYDRPGKVGLVLAPTRELASQIHKVMRQMARGSRLEGALVVGGESFHRQTSEIRRGVDYIIATPGRLNDHLQQRTIDLSKVCFLVLDEVDRMLDMGFLPQIKDVMRFVPKQRQTLLFSATLPTEVARFVELLVTSPHRIAVGDSSKPSSQVTQTIRRLGPGDKQRALIEELRARQGKVLVFVRTKSRTQRLLRLLEHEGFEAACLHGGRTQAQRKHALEKFRRGSHPVLIATDLAGRGLDIVDVDTVINFDAPSTREDYIHRIGRTGRLDRTGEAVTFVEQGNADEEQVVTGIRPPRPAPGPRAPRPPMPVGQQGPRRPQGRPRHQGFSPRSGQRSAPRR